MALFTPGVIPQAILARSYVGAPTEETNLHQLVARSILRAMNLLLFVVTVDVVGNSAISIQNVLFLLANLGYTVTQAGTLLTISW